MNEDASSRPGEGSEYLQFRLSVQEGRLRVLRSDGEPLGVLSSRLFSIMRRLVVSECVLVEPVISLAAYKTATAEWKRIGTSGRCAIELNVYSHRHAAKETGKALGQAGMYLQPPGSDFRHIPYENPQCLDLHDVMDVNQFGSEDDHEDPLKGHHFDLVAKDFSYVLDHLPRPNYLREFIVDRRVITPLHGYQREAADFICRRESNNMPSESTLWERRPSKFGLPFYQHVITGAKNDKPEDFQGGILADDMGLGKSLTMLSIIINSLARALSFAFTNTIDVADLHRKIVPSKATLIVVPSACKSIDCVFNQLTVLIDPSANRQLDGRN